MGRIAFVFAGQGAQAPGMGKDLYDSNALAQGLMDRAEAIRPGTLKTCFDGPMDRLTETVNAQPCLFVMDYVCAVLAEEAVGKPSACAGFSLGEVAAAAYSGLLSFEDAFRAVIRRGALMQACAEANPGAMFAVLKLPAAQVVSICAGIPKVYPVNYNCPGQTVVACACESAEALSQAVRAAKGRALRLNVSGPFHSPFMREASDGMRAALDEVAFCTPGIPLYSNLTAKPYEIETARDTLAMQISSPVRWQETVENLIASGVDGFIEVGPGQTLAGLIGKIHPEVRVQNVSGLESLEALSGRSE